MGRYLAVIPERTASDQTWRRALTTLRDALGYQLFDHAQFGLITEASPLETRWASECDGAVIGALFRRSDYCPVAHLSEHNARAIVTTGGGALIQHYWGNYVAVIADEPGDVKIVRAPFGDLACYYRNYDGGMLVASDLELMTRFDGVRSQVDMDAVASQLIAPDIRRSATCLEGISELQGGDRLSLHRLRSRQSLWTPWTFVAPERRIDDRDEAAAKIAETICATIAAVTNPYASTVLLLSGGLDSSIVAASLARAGRSCTALTMVTHAAGGDERDYARRTAGHLGFSLREVLREASAVDVSRSAAADLPYPIERSFTQATTAAAQRVAEEVGAGVVLHGGGGDNIFCALQSAAPLADLVQTHGLDRRSVRLTRDIATNAQATSTAVVKQAAARLLWRAPGFRWEPKLDLLSPAGLTHEAAALRHPWLDPPDGALSGSSGHIGLVLAALSVVQSPNVRAPLRSRGALLTQPVIEACLSIPTWLWFERGRNRAVARRAFSPLLPEEVAWRATKGAMDSFIVEIFETNRASLKAMLCDGALARSGLIDRTEVTRLIDETGPVRGRDFGRVMQFADVEAWLASWA